MDNMVRKTGFTLILLCLCLLTGCFSEHISNRMVAKRANEYMKCVAEKDEKKLFSYFAEDIKDDRKELTMEEIKEAFDSVIDGNIVSFSYHHVWKEYPEREGLRNIYIYIGNNISDNVFIIGGKYSPDNE